MHLLALKACISATSTLAPRICILSSWLRLPGIQATEASARNLQIEATLKWGFFGEFSGGELLHLIANKI